MSTNDTVPFRPLGILKMVLENIGFEVTHCYEDLVFIEHNAFLLRMEEKGEDISLLFNSESDIDKRGEIAELLKNSGETHNLVIARAGTYTMIPNRTDGTINLEFQE